MDFHLTSYSCSVISLYHISSVYEVLELEMPPNLASWLVERCSMSLA